MGAGYYVAAAHPPDMDRRTVDDLAREIIADVTVGVGDTGVRAGLIGEIGCTWPWTDNEKKVVRAAVAAQRETGAPLMIHPGRNPGAPMEIAEFVRKEGGDLRRTIMCHIDRTIADVRAVIDLAQTGIWLEYDLFGLENSYYPYQPAFDMPNDGGRMAHVLALMEAGHADQILLSHDIAYKTLPGEVRRLRLSPPAGERGAAPPAPRASTTPGCAVSSSRTPRAPSRSRERSRAREPVAPQARTRSDFGSYGGVSWARAGTRSQAISISQRPLATNASVTPSGQPIQPSPTARPTVWP